MQHAAGTTSIARYRPIERLSQIGEEALNAPNGALMPFHLPRPAMADRIFHQLPFTGPAAAQTGSIFRGRYELGVPTFLPPKIPAKAPAHSQTGLSEAGSPVAWQQRKR